jgi:hypothetical protein
LACWAASSAARRQEAVCGAMPGGAKGNHQPANERKLLMYIGIGTVVVIVIIVIIVLALRR